MTTVAALICVLAIVAGSNAASIHGAVLAKTLRLNSNLKLLGQIPTSDGGLKMFFSDTSKSVTFDEAQIYCKSYDLKAATFVDKAEFHKVVRFLPRTQRLWTSAVNANVFKWDDGHGDEIHESLDIVVVPYDHSTCITIFWEQMFADPCQNQLEETYYPLCELQLDQDGIKKPTQ